MDDLKLFGKTVNYLVQTHSQSGHWVEFRLKKCGVLMKNEKTVKMNAATLPDGEVTKGVDENSDNYLGERCG